MTESVDFQSAATEHRISGERVLHLAVLTVSDSRTLESDTGGALIRQLVEESGHVVADYLIVSDDDAEIQANVSFWVADESIDAIILTGGTGLAPRDRTFEAIAPLLDRQIDGFGELFRMLSFSEIGAAAMLSRAFAGVVARTPLFALPGSRNAIALAMNRLILPEIGHVVFESRKETQNKGGRVDRRQ